MWTNITLKKVLLAVLFTHFYHLQSCYRSKMASTPQTWRQETFYSVDSCSLACLTLLDLGEKLCTLGCITSCLPDFISSTVQRTQGTSTQESREAVVPGRPDL